MFFKKTINTKSQLQKLDEKIRKSTNNFNEKFKELESFAERLYKKNEIYENKLDRFKTFCHNINILITDKDKDLKLLFANHTVCNVLYNLPNLCSDLIEDRFEWEVINDFIEKTGKWNSFVECQNFNIDEIVISEMKEKEFIQIGKINDEILILQTQLKPHIRNNEFDGIMTISNVIDEYCFDKIKKNKIYDKNDYVIYEIESIGLG